MAVQIINTAGYSKTSTYIAETCANIIKDLKRQAPNTTVAGFVMDSASANRAAMSEMDSDDELSPLVNLQCAAHMLSLLMKDIAKRFEWVSGVYDACLELSAIINGSERFRRMFTQQCLNDEDRCSALATHCDTRFGSKYLVVTSVDRRLSSLKRMVGTPEFLDLVTADNENAVKMHKMLSGRLTDSDGLVKRLPVLKQLCGPIMKALAEVETDKASLSRMRALIRQLEAHVQSFDKEQSQLCASGIIQKGKPPTVQVTSTTMIEVFNHRLRDFYYKPCMTVAFLLDPINFRKCEQTGTVDLPFDALSHEEENEACCEIERLAGNDSAAVVSELATMKLHGIHDLSNLNADILKQCMLVEEKVHTSGSVKRTSAPVHQRMQCWLRMLQPTFPKLSRVAAMVLSMHCTSCASERNLSVFGRLFEKHRSTLQLDRGAKMIYLAVNDRIQKGILDTSKEELHFMDSDIEEDEDIAPVAVDESMEQALAGGVPGDIDDVCEPDPNDPRRRFFY
jgi:hAT family C-terminal dimerisation region